MCVSLSAAVYLFVGSPLLMANDEAQKRGRGEALNLPFVRCELSAIWVQMHWAESGRRTVEPKRGKWANTRRNVKAESH